jgi:hypothetical protein
MNHVKRRFCIREKGTSTETCPLSFQLLAVRVTDKGGLFMQYRSEVASIIGLVQQLASNILPHGYWFYVTGFVPEGKCPLIIDQKLIEKYGINLSRQQRARRKQAGFANLHYLRCERWWIILATHGEHRFFEEERDNLRDARQVPIQVGGYSLTVKPGNFLRKSSADLTPTPDHRQRVRVQIARQQYRELCAYFLDRACHRSVENLSRDLFCLRYEPYAPVRKQLLNLLRLINQKRQQAGYAKIPPSVLRYKREIVKPFAAETAENRSKKLRVTILPECSIMEPTEESLC